MASIPSAVAAQRCSFSVAPSESRVTLGSSSASRGLPPTCRATVRGRRRVPATGPADFRDDPRHAPGRLGAHTKTPRTRVAAMTSRGRMFWSGPVIFHTGPPDYRRGTASFEEVTALRHLQLCDQSTLSSISQPVPPRDAERFLELLPAALQPPETQSGRRDLNPRPPEPHAHDSSGESRQRVATTRCSGHRCCDSNPEDRPGIAAESQRSSQRD